MNPECETSKMHGANERGVVNGQGRDPYANIPFGLSSVGKAGCGLFAVHNAIVLHGEDSCLYDVWSYFSSQGESRIFGIMPWEIGSYLTLRGISYDSSSAADIIEKVQSKGVAIATFWNNPTTNCRIYNPETGFIPMSVNIPNVFGGAHTVAITYSDGQYYVYNPYNSQSSPSSDPDYINTITAGFIYGYYIGGE